MNLSIASYELWFKTCSLFCLSFTDSTLVGCQTAACSVVRKFIEQRYFLVFTYHWKKCRWGCKLTRWLCGVIITHWWKISTPHLALLRVCCYVFTLPPWSLCSSPNGPPCSLNIFPNLPVQDICAYFVHFALNTVVLDEFLVHFPAKCWVQLKFLLTDQCTLEEPPTHAALPLPSCILLVVWPS